MLGLLSAWVPDASVRDAIVREYPARLYDFKEPIICCARLQNYAGRQDGGQPGFPPTCR